MLSGVEHEKSFIASGPGLKARIAPIYGLKTLSRPEKV